MTVQAYKTLLTTQLSALASAGPDENRVDYRTLEDKWSNEVIRSRR